MCANLLAVEVEDEVGTRVQDESRLSICRLGVDKSADDQPATHPVEITELPIQRRQ
jgi:hypothetical protein